MRLEDYRILAERFFRPERLKRYKGPAIIMALYDRAKKLPPDDPIHSELERGRRLWTLGRSLAFMGAAAAACDGSSPILRQSHICHRQAKYLREAILTKRGRGSVLGLADNVIRAYHGDQIAANAAP